MIRSRKQIIWDYAATLKLFEEVSKVGEMDGNLKLQKLTFLAELEGLKIGLAVSHFKFFRYNYGPFSKDLVGDVQQLTDMGFCTAGRKLTKRGQFILDYIKPEIERSDAASNAFALFGRIAEEYGRRGGKSLMNSVYRMVVPVYDLGGQEVRVEKIPFHTDILVPTCEKDLTEVIPFDAEMITELEEELETQPELLDSENPSYQKSVKEALARLSRTVNA